MCYPYIWKINHLKQPRGIKTDLESLEKGDVPALDNMVY